METETSFTGFADRTEAGHRLAAVLKRYRGKENAIVLGLPRGGVVTAAAVAEDLDLPLDVLVVRKLGLPGEEELAIGAIAAGGIRVLDECMIALYNIPGDAIARETVTEMAELERRERLYRRGLPPLNLARKTVIVVDDGLATGATMSAAVSVIRRQNPLRIVVAVPVTPMDVLVRLRHLVDEIDYLETPEPFQAVGYWYVDFEQVDDDEVMRVLERARSRVLT